MIINASAHRIPLADKSVHAIVTSGPYFGLRDYEGHQIVCWSAGSYLPCTGIAERINVPAMTCAFGAEPTVEAFVWHSLLILRECKRVLRDDGVIFWNLGDSYNGGNLVGVPYRVMLAAQADGLVVRNDLIWAKVSVMPESMTGYRWVPCRFRSGKGKPWQDCPGCDKCRAHDGHVLERGSWRHTRAHELFFQLSKGMQYWMDGDVVRELAIHAGDNRKARAKQSHKRMPDEMKAGMRPGQAKSDLGTRNPRSVLRIDRENEIQAQVIAFERYLRYLPDEELCDVLTPPPSMYGGKHFAVFPPELIRNLIMAAVPRWSCPQCGAGWSPIVHQSVEFAGGSGKAGNQPVGKGAGGVQTESGDYDIRLGPVVRSHIKGYRPSCGCGVAESIPGIVLDPFCGSGTTGEVARECNVRFIGLDISFPYLSDQAAWRAERRISPTRVEKMPLFADVA